jgi:hypothetical protein
MQIFAIQDGVEGHPRYGSEYPAVAQDMDLSNLPWHTLLPVMAEGTQVRDAGQQA